MQKNQLLFYCNFPGAVASVTVDVNTIPVRLVAAKVSILLTTTCYMTCTCVRESCV